MIERIVIDNFKSIKHADVKLQKINVLIGPNNSGKSNFLKAIDYLSKLGISTNGDIDPNKMYGLNIESAVSEIYLIVDGRKMPFNFDQWEGSPQEWKAMASFFKDGFSSEIYKIIPDNLKKMPPIATPAKSLSNDGANIAVLLQSYLNKNRNIFNKICTQLQELTGYFNDIIIDLVTYDGSSLEKNRSQEIYSKIGLQTIDGKTFWAEDLSEGVLYLLSLLCIVNHPSHPKLLLLEEPETGIHPKRIKDVIDLIRNLSDEKDIQVILTTHSPLVVDLFEDEPECIQVFEMKDGFTEIKNLQTDIIEPINKELEQKGIAPNKDYGTTLGEQWVFGFLGGVPV